MRIVVEDLVLPSGGAINQVSGTTVATMPAENLRVFQPSVRWRALGISSVQIEVDVDFGRAASHRAFDVVAVIGYDGAEHRNLLRNAGTFTATGWSVTNLSASPFAVPAPPVELPFAPSGFRATAAGAAFVEQIITKPAFVAWALRFAILVHPLGGDDVDLRLRLFAGANEARVDFDISAGTVGAPGSTVFTVQAQRITALSAGWFLCELEATTDTATTVTARWQMLTAAGSTTMVGGEDLALGPAVVMFQATDASVAEYPTVYGTTAVEAATGPIWKIAYELGADLTPWLHGATRNRMRSWGGRYSFLHQFATPQLATTSVAVFFWDPHNALAYIEAGRLIIGRSVQLKGTIIGHAFEETGVQQEADGGQIYRPQRRVRRREELVIRYLDRKTAFDDLQFLRRQQGRSRQVLIVAEEDETKYLQEGLVYGYIDDIGVPMPVSAPTPGWVLPVTIVETP